VPAHNDIPVELASCEGGNCSAGDQPNGSLGDKPRSASRRSPDSHAAAQLTGNSVPGARGSLDAVRHNASALAQNPRGIACSSYAVNPNRLIELGVPGTAVADGINSGTTKMAGSWLRRAAYREHSDAAIGGIAGITKPRHTGEVPAATAFNAIGIAGTGLPINPCGTGGAAIFASSAEPGYTRKLAAAASLHTVGIAGPGLAVNPGRINGGGIGAAAANAPYPLGETPIALAVHSRAIAVRVAEARYT
jgi:hypothetical protein